MNQKQKQAQIAPPYVSFKTFSSAISSLAEHGIPAQIDRSVLGKYSGGVQSQLLLAFRFFGFANEEGRVNEKFHEYAKADSEKRKAMLADLLKTHFPNQTKILSDGTIQQLTDSFNYIKVKPSVKEKCIAFFLRAVQEAGLDISTHIIRGTRAKRQKEGPPKGKKRFSKVSGEVEKEKESLGFQEIEGMSIIPIALGPGKVWNIQVNANPSKEDVARFTKIIEIVLEGKTK